MREFYSQLPHPVLVGIEAIGPMQWFLKLHEESGIECQVGDATKIRAAEPRSKNLIDACGINSEAAGRKPFPISLRLYGTQDPSYLAGMA